MSCNIRQSHQGLAEVQYVDSGHYLEHPECTVLYTGQHSKAFSLEAQQLRDKDVSALCLHCGHTRAHGRREGKKILQITQSIFSSKYPSTTSSAPYSCRFVEKALSPQLVSVMSPVWGNPITLITITDLCPEPPADRRLPHLISN